MWKCSVNYMKWGYANYVGIALSLVTIVTVVKGFLFPNTSIFLKGPVVLVIVIPLTISIGKWDYRRGTYPELAEISTTNSEPAKDSYRALLAILNSLPDNEEVEQVRCNVKRWIK